MQGPESSPEPASSRFGPGWSRSRVIFLAVSGILILALLIWAREVLLPFVLALIIAYVLTPLVALAERARVPRPGAILGVYAATLGLSYLSIAAIAPRVYLEGERLVSDAPRLAREGSTKYGPKVEKWMDDTFRRARVAPISSAGPETPGIQVVPKPNGAFEIQVGSGVEVVQQGPGRWHIGEVTPEPRFSVTDLTEKGIQSFVSYVKGNALELIKFGHSVVRHVVRAIFLLFMTLMLAGYIMHTRESIIAFFRSLVPALSRLSFDRLLLRIDRGLSGVVRGQLLICLVNGLLSAIGFWMFGLKYWPILAIVAGLMSIVPIFGSILSSVPAVFIGLTQDFWIALWVLLWIVGIHQIEANLLNPKIIGVAAKIHPVLVVFALLVGEHYFGLWGALLGVPALSIAQSLFNHFRFESMPDAPPDSLLPGPAIRLARGPD